MALRNALTRVAGPLRGAVQSAALHQTSVIGPSIVPVGHQTRSYRNRVENELYDQGVEGIKKEMEGDDTPLDAVAAELGKKFKTSMKSIAAEQLRIK